MRMAKAKKVPKKKSRARKAVVKTPTPDPVLVLDGFPAKVRKTLGLCTYQEQKFVMKYTGEARGNAVLAAQLAGIPGGYSAQASRGSTMLKSAHVRAAVDAWMEAYGMSAAQLTHSIAELIQVNPGPFTKWNVDGTIEVKVPKKAEWEAHKHWVKGWTCDPDTGRVVKVELHDAFAARRELAKILKLYSDAPIFALHLHFQSMTDDEILRQWDELEGGGTDGDEARLMPGTPPGLVS